MLDFEILADGLDVGSWEEKRVKDDLIKRYWRWAELLPEGCNHHNKLY